MKSHLTTNPRRLAILFFASCLGIVTIRAEQKAEPPREIVALAAQFVKALQTGDVAAMMACWHPADAVVKLKETDARTYSNPPKKELARYLGQEAGRQADREADNKVRFAALRKQIARHFGDPAKITLVRVDLDPDDQDNPTFEDVEILMMTEKGVLIEYEIEAAVRLNDNWKFMGRADDEFSIELQED
jgi:hypothetical protein